MGTNSGLGGGAWASGAAGGSITDGSGNFAGSGFPVDPEAGAGVRVGVVTFPGSLDDRDAARAVRMIGAEAVPLWHGTHDLEGVDAVILPGGFSYGDYLRAGAIASLSPIMSEVIDAANGGLPVLGICNGFQMLTEAHLLPGGLIRNDHGNFICRDQRLRVENTSTAWTNAFAAGAEITIPLKNGEGGFIAAADDIARLEDGGPRGVPLPRGEPQRLHERHRRRHERPRQRGGPHAAP